MKDKKSHNDIKRLTKILLEEDPERWPSPFRELSDRGYNSQSAHLDQDWEAMLSPVLEQLADSSPSPPSPSQEGRGRLLRLPSASPLKKEAKNGPWKRASGYRYAAAAIFAATIGASGWLYYYNYYSGSSEGDGHPQTALESHIQALHIRVYGQASIHGDKYAQVVQSRTAAGSRFSDLSGQALLFSGEELEVGEESEVYFNANEGVVHYIRGPTKLRFISRDGLQIFQIRHGSIALRNPEESEAEHNIIWETDSYRYTLAGTVAHLSVHTSQNYQKLMVYKGAIKAFSHKRSKRSGKSDSRPDSMATESSAEDAASEFDRQESEEFDGEDEADAITVKGGEAMEIDLFSGARPDSRSLRDDERIEIAMVEKKTTQEMLRRPLPPSQKIVVPRPTHLSPDAMQSALPAAIEAEQEQREPAPAVAGKTEAGKTEAGERAAGLKERLSPSQRRRPHLGSQPRPAPIKGDERAESLETADSIERAESPETEENIWRLVQHRDDSFQFNPSKRYRISIRLGISYSGLVENRGNWIIVNNAGGSTIINRREITAVEELL